MGFFYNITFYIGGPRGRPTPGRPPPPPVDPPGWAAPPGPVGPVAPPAGPTVRCYECNSGSPNSICPADGNLVVALLTAAECFGSCIVKQSTANPDCELNGNENKT